MLLASLYLIYEFIYLSNIGYCVRGRVDFIKDAKGKQLPKNYFSKKRRDLIPLVVISIIWAFVSVMFIGYLLFTPYFYLAIIMIACSILSKYIIKADINEKSKIIMDTSVTICWMCIVFLFAALKLGAF